MNCSSLLCNHNCHPASVKALWISLVVLASDQAIKFLLRRHIRPAAVPREPIAGIRVVEARIWVLRLGMKCSGVELWCLWAAAATPLAIVATLLPPYAAFVGLLLGGSLSHVVESSTRGSITDYACLRFWPASNLADLALTVGAIGALAELLITVSTTAF